MFALFPLRRTAIALVMTLALASCGGDAASPSAGGGSASSAASSSASPNTTVDLSAISCATDDPEDVGDLTGAWAGDDDGVYYIRQVGDCVWWFGTSLPDIEPGQTGQPGWSNVASGRVDGEQVEVEWADVPVGEVLGGGGLTLVYVEENDQLAVSQRRGDWDFGATMLTRIPESSPSPDASPIESASP